MRYPVESPAAWRQVGRLSLAQRLRLLRRTRRQRARTKSRDGIELACVRRAGPPPGPREVVLLCVAKDSAPLLPSLLAHHRRLGISRFAFVDDGSRDGTRELLLEAPDVDLWESNVRFREASGGLAWRDMLIDRYGRDRWYVTIDADEYLVYPGSEERPVGAFVDDLVRAKADRALAAMIDLYPDGLLGGAPPDVPADAPPTATCPLFDGTGYTLTEDRFCLAVRGGPRMRLFGTDMRLTKFPVLFADRRAQLEGWGHHAPLPFQRNFSPVRAVLLHHKFAPGAVQAFRAIAEQGTHAGGSRYYRDIVASGALHEGLDLRYPGSRRWAGSQDLVDAGFLQDLRERRP